jgi:hypothetical protein
MGNGDLIENATGQLVYFYKDAGLQKINVSIENKNTKIIEAQTQVLTVIAQNRPPVAAMNCNSPAPLKLFCNPMSSNDIDGTIIRYEYEIDGKILSSAAPDFINYYYGNANRNNLKQ